VFSFRKAIDTVLPSGPEIVTKDEIPDPQHLAIERGSMGTGRRATPAAW